MAKTKKRKDGRYYERIALGYRNKKGVLQYKYVYGDTIKQLREKVDVFRTDMRIYGEPIVNTRITLNEWGYKHLFTNTITTVNSSTFAVYMSIYEVHILNSAIGCMSVQDIKQIHLQNYFNSRTEYSKATLKKVAWLIKTFFKSAISNNIIRINPMQDVKIPNSYDIKRNTLVMTLEEQKAYTRNVKSVYPYELFMTALYTGLRQGELIALKWNNLDFEKSQLTVKESYKIVRKYNIDGSSSLETIRKGPKTESSKRTIYIPRFLCSILQDKKAKCPKNNENLVFTNIDGSVLTANQLNYRHRKICRLAKIRPREVMRKRGAKIVYDGVNFHALRHTFATRLIESGVDVKTVSETLGHKDVMITLNTYVHSTDETKKASAEAMERFYINNINKNNESIFNFEENSEFFDDNEECECYEYEYDDYEEYDYDEYTEVFANDLK